MATQEEHVGTTPNGGVRSVAYFFDDEHNSVDKAEATGAEIIEYDADGKVVGRTYGTFPKSSTAPPTPQGIPAKASNPHRPGTADL